jgi:hypothetical protein
MKNSFDTGFGFIKGFMVLVFLLILFLIGFKAFIIMDAKKDGKVIYEIEVNSFKNVETYTTYEYKRDKESGCITFKDEFGIKHVVCNNYTITEY